MSAKWIWLNDQDYASCQRTFRHIDDPARESFRYCVAEFRKDVAFSDVPTEIRLNVSGDTHFRLYADGTFLGEGPAAPGGDFLRPKGNLDWYYSNPYTVCPAGKEVRFFAEVQLSPQVLTEISYGSGGFYLEGEALFADGSTVVFGTDAGWQARLNGRFTAPCVYDETLEPDAWLSARETGDERALTPAPVKMLEFEKILPPDPALRQFRAEAGKTTRLEFDKVYGASVGVEVTGPCSLVFNLCESEGVGRSEETMTFAGEGSYCSFRMHSVAVCDITVKSAAEGTVLKPYLRFRHYPAPVCGSLDTSDPRFRRIFDLCAWTLKICRQTIHLDSTTHQELLACTGDYYIETLMTLFTYGDMSLARGDVLRTAAWLVQNDGRMFHTTYSLIWVQMLKLVYDTTGDRQLLDACRPALDKLTERFASYTGRDGVIEDPPDYMFVDWMVADGYSLHHPPKYLGQTVLNCFYYGALKTAGEIAATCGWNEKTVWESRAAGLKQAFDSVFYDEEKGLYIDGLPDETRESKWQPANVPKRHFSRYPNILAPLYGLCSRERAIRLLTWAADDATQMPPVQPYFLCYLLLGMEKYGLLSSETGKQLLLKWSVSADVCGKGLQEGWYKPEETYSFDHSHAWGGCPAYFIPQMLLGMRIEEPGMKKLSFRPALCGLERAELSFPTPYGMIRCSQRKEEDPVFDVPEEISWELRRE